MNQTVRMPVFFIGHGSPMNALANNSYTQTLASLHSHFPAPRAILCISAHWMTEDTRVNSMLQPPTIHDFYGFPQALFDIRYPAAGSPDLARRTVELIKSVSVIADNQSWGLDHGCWSVLTHLFPSADIPVVQLSLDLTRPAEYHYQLGRQLQPLRDEGVLIIGSGNIVHNLRVINREPEARSFDWAITFDEWVRDKLLQRDFTALISDYLKTDAGKLSVPTPEHYLPLLYILGAVTDNDTLRFEYEGMQHASISMRSFRFGAAQL